MSAQPGQTEATASGSYETLGALGLDELWAQFYDKLRRLARVKKRREHRGHPLQTSDLVHEAYLRLARAGKVSWKSRAYFFAAAAKAMRRILVEVARRHQRIKHGGNRTRRSLDTVTVICDDTPLDILALNEALAKLEQKDERAAQIVELRYFAELTINETARTIGISPAAVKREWSHARAWLYREIRKGDSQSGQRKDDECQ